MSISETAELYRQRSKLWFHNAKWNYQAFYSIYRSRGVRKLVIPVGITRSERVNKYKTIHRKNMNLVSLFSVYSHLAAETLILHRGRLGEEHCVIQWKSALSVVSILYITWLTRDRAVIISWIYRVHLDQSI